VLDLAGRVVETRRPEAVIDDRARLREGHEAGGAQERQVVLDGRLGQLERRGDLGQVVVASREQVEDAQKRLASNTFTLEDFRAQLGQVNRLGSLDQILGMLPGGQKLKGATEGQMAEREMKRVAAMIDSMTFRERRDHTVINASRKKRIARGSGTNVQEVNRLIKQFLSARKIAKVMAAGSGGRRQFAQLMRSR